MILFLSYTIPIVVVIQFLGQHLHMLQRVGHKARAEHVLHLFLGACLGHITHFAHIIIHSTIPVLYWLCLPSGWGSAVVFIACAKAWQAAKWSVSPFDSQLPPWKQQVRGREDGLCQLGWLIPGADTGHWTGLHNWGWYSKAQGCENRICVNWSEWLLTLQKPSYLAILKPFQFLLH